jgi:hypothetical protein
MQEAELEMLAAQLADVLVRFEERCQRNEQLQRAAAEQLPAIVEDRLGRWLQTATGQVEGAVRTGFVPPLADYTQSVRNFAGETDKAVRTLQGAKSDFTSMRRWVLWGLCASLVLCIVALVGTYQLLYGYYQTRYDQLKSQVTYLEAINRSDVAPCGDGRLCARIDEKAPRVGDKGQYRLIELRP